MPDKQVTVIAGPNGSGKTTFALEYLPGEADCDVFINADFIAFGISPLHPERATLRAGRLMVREMSLHMREGRSFAVETTLAGRGYARMIRRWRADGYFVKLIFLSLPSAEEAIARVAKRVSQGGHGLPESVIRRRFEAGLRNFRNLYCHCVDKWLLFDNTGTAPVLVEEGPNCE